MTKEHSVTSGRADTAMTDPRIALADRLQFMLDTTSNEFPETKETLAQAVSALRAIQPETGVRAQAIAECAKVADRHFEHWDKTGLEHPEGDARDRCFARARAVCSLASAIRALSASKPGAVASAPVHPTPGVDAAAPVRGRTG